MGSRSYRLAAAIVVWVLSSMQVPAVAGEAEEERVFVPPDGRKWKLTAESVKSGGRLTEFVPADWPAQTWLEKVTLEKVEGGDRDAVASRVESAIRDNCTEVEWRAMDAGDGGLIYEYRTVECQKTEAHAEIGVVLAGGRYVHRVAYTARERPTFEARRDQWYELLRSAKVVRSREELVEAMRSAQAPPLYVAAGTGTPDEVRGLLGRGEAIGAATPQGSTALHAAAFHGREDTLAVLLDAAAPLDARDRRGRTPLMEAVHRGHASVARRLIAAGADPDVADETGDTPLLMAVQARAAELVDALLAAGADPNPRNMHEASALQHAVYQGDAGLVQRLLDAGARPVVPNGLGTPPGLGASPYSLAGMQGYSHIEKILDRGLGCGDGAQSPAWVFVPAVPLYPRAAHARRIEGRVEVEFTIDDSYEIDEVRIVSAEPEGAFDREAKEAVRRFEIRRCGRPLAGANRSARHVFEFTLADARVRPDKLWQLNRPIRSHRP